MKNLNVEVCLTWHTFIMVKIDIHWYFITDLECPCEWKSLVNSLLRQSAEQFTVTELKIIKSQQLGHLTLTFNLDKTINLGSSLSCGFFRTMLRPLMAD